MADELLKAGKYELHAQWDELTSKPGQPAEFVRHEPGDIVDLNQEEANRLARVISKPGERAKQAAAVAKAEADRLSAIAAEAEERAKEQEKDARSTTRAGSN